MIRGYLARGSFARRIVTRAVVVMGAVLVGGQVMRTLPHDQTLVFPVGSLFPQAVRFSASWKQPSDDEQRGGVSLSFSAAPPLQIREHARLPDGDYIVTVAIEERAEMAERGGKAESSSARAGLQTNIERRVNLGGGETIIVLAPSHEPSVSE